MNRGEIVAPAGSLEKLKFAVYYGADTVYFGGEKLNLRDKSKNFDLDEIEQALAFAHEHGVRVTFLLNAFVHESDIGPVKEYLQEIEHFDFDSVMISDPAMLELVQNSKLQSKIYLSTQASTLNHMSANFWQRNGVSRIVLARETTLDDIRNIRQNSDIELEIFAHGAVCISYSGRCLLSRYLSGRDANQGACSHPCRWNFALVEEKRPGFNLEIIEHERNTHILSSKDLCLIHHLKDYIEAGVTAFKLEGRMKSLYYAANVTRVYRHALEHIAKGEDLAQYTDFYNSELDKISHRPYTADLFNEFEEMENRDIAYINKAQFMGYIVEADGGCEALVKPFNPIRPLDKLEAVFPLSGEFVLDTDLTVEKIISTDTEQVDTLARPQEIAKIVFNKPVYAHGILRKITS